MRGRKEGIRARLLAIACLILGLVGCGVVPSRVQYAEYPKEVIAKAGSNVSGYQFRHRRSVIMLEYQDKEGAFKATAVPYELTVDGSYGPLYRIWGTDDWRSTTQLKVSYVDNTKFIDQLQVATKDNVADTISKIGKVAAAVVGLAASVVAAPIKGAPEPKFHKTMVDPAQAGIDKWTGDPLNKGYCVRLKDVVCESSLSLQHYVSEGLGKWQGTFPVPACATGVVEIAEASQCDKADANIKASIRVTFAHASNVLPISLPSSGSLKMNSVCGASVTELDTQDRTEVLTYLSGVITQIQDISAAWKKSKAGTATAEKATTEKQATEKPKTGK